MKHQSSELADSADKWEYLVVPLQEAKGLKKADDPWAPDQLNDLGRQGWEAIGLSLKYGDFIAWPVVLAQETPELSEDVSGGIAGNPETRGPCDPVGMATASARRAPVAAPELRSLPREQRVRGRDRVEPTLDVPRRPSC